MTNAQLISSTSMGSLDGAAQQKVISFFNRSTPQTRKTDIEAEFSMQQSNPTSASLLFYSHTLWRTNPAMFSYMTADALSGLESDLQLIFYHLCGRYQMAIHESRHYQLAAYEKDIEQCAALIEKIGLARSGQQIKTKLHYEKTAVVNFLFESEINFFDAKTRYIRKRMGDFNYWRLYWVWTGVLLRTIISMMSKTFYQIQQTDFVTTEYQNIWGYISWMLYFARLLLNLCIVFKHTFPCSLWMSDEEMAMVKEQGIYARFKDQLLYEGRVFSIANDVIWGVVNMACHLWWVGAGVWGYVGNVATTLLLLGDLMLTIQRRAHELDAFDQNNSAYRLELDGLKQKISVLDPDTAAYHHLMLQKERLEEALAQNELNRQNKEKSLNVDRAYAAGLLVAFIILCACHIPEELLSATALTAFGLTGAGLLFSVSLAYSIYNAYLEISQAQDAMQNALKDCQTIQDAPREGLTQAQIQLLALRYQQSQAESDYQKNMVTYYQYKLIRTAIIETLIPLAIFAAFTFLSFGLATAMMALGLVISVASCHIIDYLKPERGEWVAYTSDETEPLLDAVNPELNAMQSGSLSI